MKILSPIVIFLALLLNNCSEQKNETNEVMELEIPSYFPKPILPAENTLTYASVLLGEKLFFDTSLSPDSTISCASCHKPSLAFADTVAFTKGVGGAKGKRNTPSILNVIFAPYFFAEGGIPNLELQALAPIQAHHEMNMDFKLLVERIARDKEYQILSKAAYSQEISPYVIIRALANFQRTLLSATSGYDRFVSGDTNALTPIEKRGMQLFFSDSLKCASCHEPPLFTNYAFANIGLYKTYTDPGRYRITLQKKDSGKFKVPSLRNVAITKPYMHDGSMTSLMEVINHFEKGGNTNANKDTLLKQYVLSKGDKIALVAFLTSLTDEKYK